MNGPTKSNPARMSSAKCHSREGPDMPACYIIEGPACAGKTALAKECVKKSLAKS